MDTTEQILSDAAIEKLKEQIQTLVEENTKLKEALGFYADIKNWKYHATDLGREFTIIRDSDTEKRPEDNFRSGYIFVAGKKARQTLKNMIK